MEGRISRENLTNGADDRPYGSANSSSYGGAQSASETRRSYYPQSTGRSASGSYKAYRSKSSKSRSGYRSYRSRNASPELIPEGRDLFVVQLLASGILLLFVMFVSIVDSEGTNAVREKLSQAFSATTSFSEFADGVELTKDKLLGGADTVKEIFGGEIETDDSGENSISSAEQAANAPEAAQADADGAAPTGDVLIDAETFKKINESAEEYSKN